MKHTLVLDTDGPQTRDELCDAIKAFHILHGNPPTSMQVPMKTYIEWCMWGSELCKVDEVPELFFGLRLSIADRFSMG
jgi:hypothetical protein